jgi:tetratricopeptide (TPR) repeat protein
MPLVSKGDRFAQAGLLLLGLLPILGRFLPPTLGWGFRHAAYLPLGFSAILLAVWVGLFIRPVRRFLAGLLFDRLGGWLFGGPFYPVLIVSSLATLLFVVLRTPTRFLGDGVLIGELAALGSPFRIHDMMDYLLHRLVLQAIGGAGSKEISFRLYAFASWVAGFVAVLTALSLLRRSRLLPIPTKVLIFALWILAAPVLLYCGYTESYAFLSIAMLGFLWSGAMAQRGDAPPWMPGLFFGLAGFFHSTASFAAPAWLFLALRPGVRKAPRGRWAAQILLPGILLPLIAIGIHLALGYNGEMFRRDVIQSKNQRHLLIALTGPHGLFSFLQVKDLLNWLLLVVPVSGWLLLARVRAIRLRLREPEIAFLVVQIGCFLLPFLLLDRKLGAARDWDLLTPQIAGFAFLAARLWESESVTAPDERFLPPVRIAAPWIALLFVAPWLAVNASREGTIRRFDEMRRDFPTFARAYSAEELAKYNYEQADFQRALVLYQECVETYPKNARTRILLGSTYLVLNRLEEAGAQYDKALELDPNSWLAMDSKARLDLRTGKSAEALSLYRRLRPYMEREPDFWSGYGYAALAEKKYAEGRDAFLRGMALKPAGKTIYYAGLAHAYLGEWDDAVTLLRRSLDEGSDALTTVSALAATLEARYAAAVAAGGQGSRQDLETARDLVKQGLESRPKDRQLTVQLNHLERVLAGQEKAANLLLD